MSNLDTNSERAQRAAADTERAQRAVDAVVMNASAVTLPETEKPAVTRAQSLSARASLEHAYKYLRKDRDAQREISHAMSRQRVEHYQQFGKLRDHQCQNCEEYDFQGSERPGMLQTCEATVRCSHIENGFRCMEPAGHDEPKWSGGFGVPPIEGSKHFPTEGSKDFLSSMERGRDKRTLEIWKPAVPLGLLEALAQIRLHYTGEAATLYYFLWLGKHSGCGVFGYGANGSYEWFIWEGGKVRASDMGYGSPEFALKDVLNRVEV